MATNSSGYAAINGARIYYEAAGEGFPLVFVHAGIADHTMWDDQFSVFAEHYRAIRFDMRGYGATEPVEGEYANRDDLLALLNTLNVRRAYLVGCSIGGGTILDFALENPDMAAALVMVASGPAGFAPDIPVPPMFAKLEEAEKGQDWERMLELEAQIWFDGEGRTPDQVDQRARAHMMAMNRRAFEHSQKRLGKHKPPLQPAAAERLGELHLPVLAVYGDRDEAYSQAAAQYMVDHIEGARKVLMLDTAHLPNMEKPEEFNQIVLKFFEHIQPE